MSYFTHVFEGPIEELVYPGAFTYRILRLPADVEAELPFTTHPRLRVTGEIAELPVSLAFNPDPGKRRYVILSTRFCRDAHIDVGDQVEFRFNIADQDAVDIPEELSALLAENSMAIAAWEALTPGKRRGLVSQIASAKTAQTRLRRAAALVDDLASGRPLRLGPSRRA
jgi:hypothetical protein